jgi:hypothetical protein
MAYPATLDDGTSFPTKTNDVSDVMAADVNNLQTAVIAVETELGTNPAGSAVDVKTRLAVSLMDAGYLRFEASGAVLTIASGSITPVRNWHTVDTESAAATDNLDTIGAGVDGQVLILRITSAARVVVIRHNIGNGNIITANELNFTLTFPSDLAICIYDDILDKWIAMGVSAAVNLAGTNTWTGINTWTVAENHKYEAVSIDTTLDGTHYMLNVDATGGAKVITLPTAIGIVGRVYVIRRVNSGGNAVTVDGAGAETINGAATYALTAQYQTVSIMSDGTNWMIVP